MRDILFRGKRIDSDSWIEGHLAMFAELTEDVPVIIEADRKKIVYKVQPETVGQFTGLTDKNGKKVFEGDIVQFYGTYNLEVFIEKGHTKIRWFDTVTNSKCKDMFYGYDEELGDCEIIGNIHDNPELLEVDDGN